MTVFFITAFVLLFIHNIRESAKNAVFFMLVMASDRTGKKRAGIRTPFFSAARHTTDNVMLFDIGTTVKSQRSYSPLSSEIPEIPLSDSDGQLLLFPEEQPELPFDSGYDEGEKNKGDHK